MRKNIRSMAMFVVFFLMALSWSPIFPVLLNIPYGVCLLLSCGSLIFFISIYGQINLKLALVCSLFVFACLLIGLVSGSTIYIYRVCSMVLLFFCACQFAITFVDIDPLCELLTNFLMIGVIGAWIGWFYAFFGGEPLFSILNLDGRENGLYLSTMSSFNYLGVIRPSYIYDEPGAFSFILCATVALREVRNLDRKKSFFLMCGGLITLSTTHFLVTIIYFIFCASIFNGLILISLLVFATSVLFVERQEFEWLKGRFSTTEDGRVGFDNRSNQIENFLLVATPEIYLYGDIECQKRSSSICEEHGDITSSPVTPVYKGGILALIGQILSHVFLVYVFIKQKIYRFSAITLTILLLQRPYFDFLGYGFIAFLIISEMGIDICRSKRGSA